MLSSVEHEKSFITVRLGNIMYMCSQTLTRNIHRKPPSDPIKAVKQLTLKAASVFSLATCVIKLKINKPDAKTSQYEVLNLFAQKQAVSRPPCRVQIELY